MYSMLIKGAIGRWRLKRERWPFIFTISLGDVFWEEQRGEKAVESQFECCWRFARWQYGSKSTHLLNRGFEIFGCIKVLSERSPVFDSTHTQSVRRRGVVLFHQIRRIGRGHGWLSRRQRQWRRRGHDGGTITESWWTWACWSYRSFTTSSCKVQVLEVRVVHERRRLVSFKTEWI